MYCYLGEILYFRKINYIKNTIKIIILFKWHVFYCSAFVTLLSKKTCCYLSTCHKIKKAKTSVALAF